MNHSLFLSITNSSIEKMNNSYVNANNNYILKPDKYIKLHSWHWFLTIIIYLIKKKIACIIFNKAILKTFFHNVIFLDILSGGQGNVSGFIYDSVLMQAAILLLRSEISPLPWIYSAITTRRPIVTMQQAFFLFRL